MKKAVQPQMTQPNITISEGDTYYEVYSNHAQIRANVWDFYIGFGRIHQNTENEVKVDVSVGIIVSPQQAKALFNLLGQNLQSYEGTFGPIVLEPQTQREQVQ